MLRHHWFRHAVPLAFALGVSLPAFAAGQGIPANAIPLATTLGDLTKLRTAYVDAFNAKDAKAVSAMYTADAVAIDVDGSMTVGAEAIAKRLGAAAPNWPHAVVSSTSVKVYGATAIDVGTWTVHPKDGGEIVSHYLVVLRRSMNGWRISSSAAVPVPK